MKLLAVELGEEEVSEIVPGPTGSAETAFEGFGVKAGAS